MSETDTSSSAQTGHGNIAWELFPVAIGRYDNHPDLDADEEADRVAALLSPFSVSIVPWEMPEDQLRRGGDAVMHRLALWQRRRHRDGTILYWVGHGCSNGRNAALAHAFSSTHPLDGSGIIPSQIARNLAEREAHDNAAIAIVIINACGSARFVEELGASVLDSEHGPRRVMLVGVSDSTARLGSFSQVLGTILGVAFAAQDTIDVWELAAELTRGLAEGRVIVMDGVGDSALRRRSAMPRFIASLDAAAEIRAVLSRLGDDERRHFIPKAQGAELGEVAWFFEGRHAEAATITGWLRGHRSGMLAVTGTAGTGKSALLGHVLMHSRPELCAVLANHGLIVPLPPQDRPPDRVFDAVLHLTGATIHDVIRRVAQAAGLDNPSEDQPAVEQVARLIRRLQDRLRPLTLLVDALDEAFDPPMIARQILRPLASTSGIRIVVGTRASTREDPDHPRPDDRDILDALGVAERSTLIVQPDQAAVTRYVRRRLQTAIRDDGVRSGQDDLDGPDPAIAAVSNAVADRSGEFLYARLAVQEIIARPQLLTLDGSALVTDLLPDDHRRLFALAVNRLRRLSPYNGPLIEALAMAQGRGLPARDGVWAAAAEALHDGSRIGYEDIGRLAEAAAPYLMLDTEHGQSVYRLAQRSFAEHFTISSRPAAGTSPGAVGQLDDRQVQITRALIRLAELTLPDPLNPYLVTHLARHAAAAGHAAWQDLADHPGVLAALDPVAVAAAGLSALSLHRLPAEILGIIGASHRLTTAPASQRQGLWQLATARYGGVVKPPANSYDRDASWTVRWTRTAQAPVHRRLTGHHLTVHAFATLLGPDGRTLLASGGADGSVRIWDPATGTPKHGPLAAHAPNRGNDAIPTCEIRYHGAPKSATSVMIGYPGGVCALAALPGPDGRTLLASGGADGSVRIWDPATGTPERGPLTGHTGPVLALAAWKEPDERTLLASAGGDGIVRICDPLAGTQIRHFSAATPPDWPDDEFPIGRPARGIAALAAFAAPDGRTLLAVGGDRGTVQIWDATAGTHIGALTGHAGRVETMAIFRGPDGRVLLATGSLDTTVRVWDPIAGTSVGTPLTGHRSGVSGLAVLPAPHGWMMMATASIDGTIRLWDLVTSASVGEPLTCDSGGAEGVGGVWALAALPDLTGRVRLVTGEGDGSVRIWNLAVGARQPPGHAEPVQAIVALQMPAERVVLAAAGRDCHVQAWDASSGTPAGDPISLPAKQALPAKAGLGDPGARPQPASRDDAARGVDRAGRVCAMAVLPSRNGRTLLAVSGAGVVQIWDPVPGDPVGAPLTVVQASTVPTASSQTGLQRQPGHAGEVHALATLQAPDGRLLLATGSADHTVRIWDLAARRAVGNALTGHTGTVRAITAFPAPDGRLLLATGSADGTIRIWEPTAGTELRCLDARSTARPAVLVGFSTDWHAVHAMAAFPAADGRALLAVNGDHDLTVHGKDDVVRIWDPMTGLPVGKPLTGHTGAVRAITAFPAPDGGMLLATGSADGTIRIWEPVGASTLAVIELGLPVGALAVAGSDLAAGTAEGIVVITPQLGVRNDLTPHAVRRSPNR